VVLRLSRNHLMQRLIILLACLALGSFAGFIGWAASGSQWWWLAIPGSIAAGWLKLANPEQCLPQERAGRGDKGAA
jgi:hypothetical protein